MAQASGSGFPRPGQAVAAYHSLDSLQGAPSPGAFPTQTAMSDESETKEVSDLSNVDVTTKYRASGDIINKVLTKVVEACVEDADIAIICELGDKMIEDETGKLYNK